MIERDFGNVIVTYDREVNAVYVYVRPAQHFDGTNQGPTTEFVPGVNVDLGADGYVNGVEVLL